MPSTFEKIQMTQFKAIKVFQLVADVSSYLGVEQLNIEFREREELE